MNRFIFAASLALAVITVPGFAGRASAGEPVPFAGVFEGERTERIPLSPTTVKDTWGMAGVGTHLGIFEMIVSVEVDFGSLPVTGEGTTTFVAANGDKIYADSTGYSEPAEPGFIWIIENGVITGGTGRFAGVSGSYTTKRLTSLTTNETVGTFKGTISAP
jgi:hypothetical protein